MAATRSREIGVGHGRFAGARAGARGVHHPQPAGGRSKPAPRPGSPARRGPRWSRAAAAGPSAPRPPPCPPGSGRARRGPRRWSRRRRSQASRRRRRSPPRGGRRGGIRRSAGTGPPSRKTVGGHRETRRAGGLDLQALVERDLGLRAARPDQLHPGVADRGLGRGRPRCRRAASRRRPRRASSSARRSASAAARSSSGGVSSCTWTDPERRRGGRAPRRAKASTSKPAPSRLQALSIAASASAKPISTRGRRGGAVAARGAICKDSSISNVSLIRPYIGALSHVNARPQPHLPRHRRPTRDGGRRRARRLALRSRFRRLPGRYTDAARGHRLLRRRQRVRPPDRLAGAAGTRHQRHLLRRRRAPRRARLPRRGGPAQRCARRA